MHLCQDEIRAIATALPFIEHLARYARQGGGRWVVERIKRSK